MPSVIDICNSALDKIGQTPIMSLADGNKAAKVCNRNWPLARDKALRDAIPNFAVRRAILAPSVTPPAWGFGSSFLLPADNLRLIEVLDHSTGDYRVEGGAILANGSVMRIRYVSRIEDPNAFDALFCDVAALALALEICEPITQSNTKLQGIAELYEQALTKATRAAAQENPPVPFEEDSWIAVRY